MKPLNLDNSPCSPTSSNCVIWQGPNIPCIKLCTGDTVSDVVFKLATELCTVLDTLNVTNYDLSCFNLTTCGPNDFQALIQFLIEQICSLQNQVTIVSDPATSPVVNNTTKSASASTLITVADCFVVDGVTVMTVSEYAQAIGTKVCSIVTEIATINNSINNLNIRVTELESAPTPTFTLPSILVDCTLTDGIIIGGNSYPIDEVLNALVNDVNHGYCALISATGQPTNLLSAISQQCVSNTDDSFANPGTPMATEYSPDWINTPVTIADTITNLWLSICDARSGILNNQITTSNTASVDLNITSNVITANITDTGWIDLNGFAYYSGVTKPQCRRIGNQVHFRGTVVVPLENPSSPGNVVTLSSTSAYNSIAGCAVWSGTGGCTINANGAIQFNNGGSVIPSSVTTATLDNIYYKPWDVATRPIDVNATYGTCLTSAVKISVTQTNGLTVQLVHDIEITTTRGSGIQGNSPLRLITSNVRVGEYLPNYIATGTDIHNAPSNANFSLVSDTFNLTWPFSCNAGEEDQIGGFSFTLDGLIGYLDPCNSETGFSVTC